VAPPIRQRLPVSGPLEYVVVGADVPSVVAGPVPASEAVVEACGSDGGGAAVVGGSQQSFALSVPPPKEITSLIGRSASSRRCGPELFDAHVFAVGVILASSPASLMAPAAAAFAPPGVLKILTVRRVFAGARFAAGTLLTPTTAAHFLFEMPCVSCPFVSQKRPSQGLLTGSG
jgi:hypothetical protein